MTEVPEHLLQRSRERRAAMGGGDGGSSGGDAGDGGSSDASAAPAPAAAAAPAPSVPAHPAPAEEPPPPPPSPMVEAYTNRRRIPVWAMPVLAMLPLWAYIFAGTLEPPPSEGGGIEELGAEAYVAAGCAGCHGGGGGGGAGPAFTDGAIYETFPSFQDHFEWVRLGSIGWTEAYGDTYGAPNKPVGGGMPGFSAETLTDLELIAVVLHERHDFGGANPDPADEELLDLVAEYLLEHPDATLEEALAEVGE